MNPPFAGTSRVSRSCPKPSTRKGAHSRRVVLIEVFTLELDDMPDQQFSVLIGYPDEAPVEAVGVGWIGNGIDTQHFKRRLKEHLAGKEQGAGEDCPHVEDLVQGDADAAAADVNGSLEERGFRLVALNLETDRQGNGDAIKLAPIFWRRLRSGGIRWHGAEEYSKKEGDRVVRYLGRMPGYYIYNCPVKSQKVMPLAV